MSTTRSLIPRLIIILLALLFLIIGYFWIHKPVDVNTVLAIGGVLIDLATVGVIAVSAGGIGRALLRWVNLTILSRSERVAVEAVFGLGAISVGALALGLIGLFRGIILWPVLLASAVLLRRAVFGWAKDFGGLVIRAIQPTTTWAAFMAIIAAILLATALFHALTPPYAWDGLVYHLVGPQRYLTAGRIASQPDNMFLGMPQNAELIFGVALSLFGRDTATAPLVFLYGVLGILAAAGLSKRFVDESAGWLTAILLLSAFSLWIQMGEIDVEMSVLAYGAALLVVLVSWREDPKLHWLILVGAVAGMALGVKQTAVGMLPAIVLFIVWHNPRRTVQNLAPVFAAALAVFGLWMVKGLLLYSNPIYPQVFGGLNWNALRAAHFSGFGTGLITTPDALQLPILPIAATLFGADRGVYYSYTVGPWLFTLPFLVLLVWPWLDQRSRKLAKDCALLGIPYLLFWMVLASLTEIGTQTRFVAFAMPVAAVMGSLALSGLKNWPEKPLNLNWILRMVIALTLCLEVTEAVSYVVRVGVGRYLMGFTNREEFLLNNLGGYYDSMSNLRNLPENAQVRLLWEPRSYYCPSTVQCIPDTVLDIWRSAIEQGQTPDEVFTGWKNEGNNYILVFDSGFQFYASNSKTAAQLREFPATLDRFMKRIWTNGAGYSLYTWQ